MLLSNLKFNKFHQTLKQRLNNLSRDQLKYSLINFSTKFYSNSRFIKKDKDSTDNMTSQTDDENIMNPKYDYTKHTLLQNLYMFGYNKDNIGYVLHDPVTKCLIGIDFGEYDKSSKIVNQLETKLDCKLKYILTTHSHNDHSGGNDRWKRVRKDEIVIVSGNSEEDIVPLAEKFMNDLETMSIGELCIACLHTPGHIPSHVSYVITQVNENSTKTPFLFCGDTLFIGGCGRVFKGTHEQLYNSLKLIGYLPNDTLIFCGHEYTEKNMEFCLKLDPDNQFLKDKYEWVKDMRKKGEFTMGSRLVEEKIYNPFLRAGDEYYMKLIGASTPEESFKQIRTLKDNF